MIPGHGNDICLVDVHEVVVFQPVADLGFAQPLVDRHPRLEATSPTPTT